MVRFLRSGFEYSSVDLLFSWEEKILKQVGAGQSTFLFFSFFNMHECFSPKSVYHVYTWCPRRPERALAPQNQSYRWLCAIMRLLRAKQVLLKAETVLQPQNASYK